MYLTKKVFVKGERRAILQGMRHAAPSAVYKRLNEELQQAVARGDLIIHEGVRNDCDAIPPRTRNEKRIRQLISLLFDFVERNMPAGYGDALQLKEVQYPREAIRADITISELGRKLDEAGFRCGMLLFLFRIIPREKLVSRMRQKKETGELKAPINKKKATLSTRLAKYFLRNFKESAVNYRNEIAFAVIQEKSGDRNLFIHYGNAHIEGLSALFEQDGWVLQESTKLDLTKYY